MLSSCQRGRDGGRETECGRQRHFSTHRGEPMNGSPHISVQEATHPDVRLPPPWAEHPLGRGWSEGFSAYERSISGKSQKAVPFSVAQTVLLSRRGTKSDLGQRRVCHAPLPSHHPHRTRYGWCPPVPAPFTRRPFITQEEDPPLTGGWHAVRQSCTSTPHDTTRHDTTRPDTTCTRTRYPAVPCPSTYPDVNSPLSYRNGRGGWG
jgi:hypothetical protein